MSYLISAHVASGDADLERLAELPESIGYRVYRHLSANVYLIDAFRAGRIPRFPFQTLVPTADLPLELPPQLRDFELLYQRLYELRLANAFKRSYVNFALLLNRLLDSTVLSLVADDDELDFACTADRGEIARLRCGCGDLIVTLRDGRAHVQPLLPEFAEDADALTDVAALRTAVPSLTIADRDVAWEPQLHAVAIDEWRSFSGSEALILGLGSFDPPEDAEELQLVAQR